MNVRFLCPACGGHHVFDMPETTIHMTCSYTHRALELRLTAGGDVKARSVDADQSPGEAGVEASAEEQA